MSRRRPLTAGASSLRKTSSSSSFAKRIDDIERLRGVGPYAAVTPSAGAPSPTETFSDRGLVVGARDVASGRPQSAPHARGVTAADEEVCVVVNSSVMILLAYIVLYENLIFMSDSLLVVGLVGLPGLSPSLCVSLLVMQALTSLSMQLSQLVPLTPAESSTLQRLVTQMRHSTLPMRLTAYRSIAAWCNEQPTVRHAVVLLGGLQTVLSALLSLARPTTARNGMRLFLYRSNSHVRNFRMPSHLGLSSIGFPLFTPRLSCDRVLTSWSQLLVCVARKSMHCCKRQAILHVETSWRPI